MHRGIVLPVAWAGAQRIPTELSHDTSDFGAQERNGVEQSRE